MNRHCKVLSLAVASAAASGCAPALELAEPARVTSNAWSEDIATGIRGEARSDLASLLASEELASLAARAERHNSNLAIADAQVAQARALLRGARLAVLPEISLSAGATRTRQAENFNFGFDDVFASTDLTWDMDLFGRLRASRQAALARTQASALSRQALGIEVEAAVARAYVQAIALQRRIVIADQNIERAVALERIIRIRYREGAASRVDLGLQSVSRLNFETDRSRLLEARDNTRTALAILVGEEAPRFTVPSGELEALAVSPMVPAPPAELLAARPDIRAAEALIAAAEGDVREARASFFPQIDVSLSGILSGSAGGPLDQIVTLGSSLLAPIFARGRLRSEFDFASAVQVETVERYRLAILNALSEVEDANSAIRFSAERAVLFEQIAEEAKETARLANLRYLEGEEDLQSLLDAQEFLADAEEAQVIARQAEVFARIALYRAMGGYRQPVLAYELD